MSKLVFTSKGLETEEGTRIIKKALGQANSVPLQNKTIYIVSFPEYEVDERILDYCVNILGFQQENVRFSGWLMPENTYKPDYIYVTGGNTFEILAYMRKYGITNFIKSKIMDSENDITYIGASAGAAIAGSDVRLAMDFDSNFMGMYDFTGLELFKGAILPHMTQEDLERYKLCTETYRLESYEHLYQVGNQEFLILETETS